MSKIEIETKNRIRKIRNPRKVRHIDLGVWSIIQVMDKEGKWHLAGHTLYYEDAQIAEIEIEDAISAKKNQY